MNFNLPSVLYLYFCITYHRVYASIILASMILISLVFYFVGTILGTAYFNPVVEDRSFMSSLGGVFMIVLVC